MTWLTALTAWPAPIGPTWVIVRPIAVRTGRARSTSASSPPTKIVSVAFRAPSLPPETGASTIRQLALGETRGEVPAARRRDRRAVDDERPGPRAGDQPVGREQDRFDVRRVRHADDRDARVGDGLGRRVSHHDAEVEQLGRAAGRPVPAGHREAGPGQVGGHRRAHRAEAEERDATALRGRLGGHGAAVPSGPAAGASGGGASVPGSVASDRSARLPRRTGPWQRPAARRVRARGRSGRPRSPR